jgi:RNA polymerase sigma factor (sigma-70 family)
VLASIEAKLGTPALASMPKAVQLRLAEGDTAAATVVEGWVRRASASFARRLGDQLDDVVQDSMLEIVQAVREGQYRGEGSFRGYVWRTAACNCLDRLRWRRRWVEVEIEPTALPPQQAAGLTNLLREEARSRLAALAARQPRHCRELWRDILAGRSYREMSERWGVSEGALRVRVLRCRRRAQAMWLEDLGNESGGETPNLLEEGAG